MDLSVEIPNKRMGSITLQDCMMKFIEAERMVKSICFLELQIPAAQY